MAALAGKVVVITGGTRGLGLAMARTFAAGGAAVVVGSRQAEAVARTVAQLAREGRAAGGIACDVGDLAQVEALAAHAVERFGRFDVWVNNAGMSAPYGPAAHIPPERFVPAVQAIVLGTYHGSAVALRHILPRRSGKLINLLGAGATKPVPYQAAYAASKAWVRMFTLALAQEYRESGVGIFAFQPGLMRTELLTRPEVIAGYEGRLKPLGMVLRLLGREPQAAAAKAAWLASSATDGRTGLEVQTLNRAQLLGGALRQGLGRLRGAPLRPVTIEPILIPPAIPTSAP
jgi:NAD(P)-dependent dehydrogenase (short-subunit alcohol dehydrogenase family)